jgi:hypothetical protein
MRAESDRPYPPHRFEAAPWPASLKLVSAVATLVLAGITVALYRAVPRGTAAPYAEAFGNFTVLLPAVIVAIAALYVVTGYELDDTTLYVRRLLWATPVPLGGLRHAWHDPSAMYRSIRLFGNNGLYAVTGIYQNSTLGRYRAFLTDRAQAVVLQLGSRVVVVSPAHPRAFLGQLASRFPHAVDIGPEP